MNLKYYVFIKINKKIKIVIMGQLKKYEITILLTEEFNDSELKTWVFNFAKGLKKFNICDISVISRGKQKLTYSINDRNKGSFIQLNFSSMPKYIEIVIEKMKFDTNVLRFLVLKK